MNDNEEMPELNQLWIKLVTSQKDIVEEVALSMSILRQMTQLVFDGDKNET